jgi:hypothetical protein
MRLIWCPEWKKKAHIHTYLGARPVDGVVRQLTCHEVMVLGGGALPPGDLHMNACMHAATY